MMNEKQQKLLEMMLGEMQSSAAPDSRQALLRFAESQMDADGRQKLQTLLRDPAAAQEMLRTQQAKALLEKLRERKG